MEEPTDQTYSNLHLVSSLKASVSAGEDMIALANGADNK